jgi:hypothetical protein
MLNIFDQTKCHFQMGVSMSVFDMVLNQNPEVLALIFI